MIEEAMSITPIIFVLVILLFGFDSTEHARNFAGTSALGTVKPTGDLRPIRRRPAELIHLFQGKRRKLLAA